MGILLVILLIIGVMLIAEAINLTIIAPSSVPAGSFYVMQNEGTYPIYNSVIVNDTISAGINQVIAEFSASNLDLNTTKEAFSMNFFNYYFNDCKVISASMISPNGTESNISVVYATTLLKSKNIFESGGGCIYDTDLKSEQLISSRINYNQ